MNPFVLNEKCSMILHILIYIAKKLNLLDLNFQFVIEEHLKIQTDDFLSATRTLCIVIILVRRVEVKDQQILLILYH